MMKFPPPLVAVIEAARAVARARLELQRSTEDEASERALASRRAAVETALVALDKSVEQFEKALAFAKAKRSPRTDWGGFFRAGTAFLDMLAKAKKGDRTVVHDAQRWVADNIVDGEVVE